MGRPRKIKRVIEDAPEERRTLQTCYVCGHKISGSPVYIPASQKHPEGLYRHIRCEAGTARWLRSDIGKSSENIELFPKIEEKEDLT